MLKVCQSFSLNFVSSAVCVCMNSVQLQQYLHAKLKSHSFAMKTRNIQRIFNNNVCSPLSHECSNSCCVCSSRSQCIYMKRRRRKRAKRMKRHIRTYTANATGNLRIIFNCATNAQLLFSLCFDASIRDTARFAFHFVFQHEERSDFQSKL